MVADVNDVASYLIPFRTLPACTQTPPMATVCVETGQVTHLKDDNAESESVDLLVVRQLGVDLWCLCMAVHDDKWQR